MNKGTKIFLIIALVLILISILAIFLMQKNKPATTNKNASPEPQNALPASQPATGSQNNQINTNTNPTQPSTNTIPIGSLAAVSPSGKEIDSPEMLGKYGKYAFETFQKYPAIVEQLKILDNSFSPSRMDPSFPSRVYRMDNGKDYLALGGCTEHNCGGTKIIVLYDVADNKVYVGKENNAQTQLQFFGNPSDQEKNTMTNFYLQK